MQEGAIDPQQPFGLFNPLTGVQRLLSPVASLRASGHNHIAVI